MADGIRKPWLLDYLIAYAEQYGGQLESVQAKRGKVQIINFRTLPEAPDQYVWADVSDKRHVVTVRFTMDAVQAFNSDLRNAGRRITSRRWAVTTIQCIKPLRCRPPTRDGKGLEEEWTLALVVDQIEVAGSEGEAMFGDPRCVTKEEPMRRWIEGFKDPHGAGGNVLKWERIERQKQGNELKPATKRTNQGSPRRPLDVAFKAEARAPGVNAKPKKPNGHQRSKQWKAKMKEIGLVLAHDHHEMPENQQQVLRGITVFGLDSSSVQLVQVDQHGPIDGSSHVIDGSISVPAGSPEPTRQPIQSSPSNSRRGLEGPTTPSSWSASQKTTLDQEPQVDEDEPAPSLSEIEIYVEQQMAEDSSDQGAVQQEQEDMVVVEQEISGPTNDQPDDAKIAPVDKSEDVMEVDEPQVAHKRKGIPPAIEGPHIAPPTPTSSVGHTRHSSHYCIVPAPVSARKPVVLVPDSDVSGSQSQSQSHSHSQSQSLTQPSISASSQQNPDQRVSMFSKPLASVKKASRAHRRDEHTAGDNDPLESDDEAAHRILTSGSAADRPSLVQGHIARARKPTEGSDLIEVSLLRDQVNRTPHSRPNKARKVSKDRVLTPANGPRAGTMPYTVDEPEHLRTKRALGEVTTPGKDGEDQPPSKRHKPVPHEVVVERVDHDVIAWKDPSFFRSRTKSEVRRKEATRKHQECEPYHVTGQSRDGSQDASPAFRGKPGDQCRPPNLRLTEDGMESKAPLTNDSETVRGSRARSMTLPGGSHRQRDAGGRDQYHDPAVSTFDATSAPTATLVARPRGQRFQTSSQTEPATRPPAPAEPHRASGSNRLLSQAGISLSAEGISPERREAKHLKLGGWRPRKNVEPGPLIMTWKDFNKMLLKVGCAREQEQRAQVKPK